MNLSTTSSSTSRIRVFAGFTLLLFSFVSLHAQSARLGPGLAAQLTTLGSSDAIEVVVTFHGDTVTADQVAAVRGLGVTRGFTFRSLPIMGVLATRDQVNALAAMPGVRSLWPNSELQYENNTATAITGVQKLKTTSFFQSRNGGFPYSGRGVSVLINDSGVDGLHQDLEFGPHVIENVEAVTNLHALSDLLPITYAEGVANTDLVGGGHGTHVAGIVGATGEKSAGKYEGVAPGAGIVGYGSGATLFILDTLGGFDYAITNQQRLRIRVINNSWGNTADVGTDFDPDDPTNVASKKANDRGIVVVFSTGNSGPAEGTTTGNFKKAPWVIAAANADKNGELHSSSSRGEKGKGGTVVIADETLTWEDRPTVTAPGTNIISTRASTNTISVISSNGPDDDLAMIEPAFLPFYVVLSGTSMAAPHVCGIVALMLEANPGLTPAQVKDILQKTATNVPGREAWEVGAGYVNAFAAVDRAIQSRNYGATVNLTRDFNANVDLSVSKTPFTIEYNPVVSQSPTRNLYPFAVGAGVNQLVARIRANGIEGSGNPIDMFLIAPDGKRYESRVPVLFAITPARTVTVDNPLPGDWLVELVAILGIGDLDVSTLPETVNGTLTSKTALPPTGLSDIAGHPAESAIKVAVGERLMDGFADGTFKPDAALTRIALADYLTMGAEVRQSFPLDGSKTFTDLTATQLPFAEAVAARSAALRDRFYQFRGVMLATAPGKFSPTVSVRRVDQAYSLVQALGMEKEALQLNGQQVTVVHQGKRIPIDDQAEIPAGVEGYVQLAFDLNIMSAFFTVEQGPGELQPTTHARFKPLLAVTRGNYATDANRFFNVF